jgi:hypothetical protein
VRLSTATGWQAQAPASHRPLHAILGPGADVVLTDMAPVLPLLRRNYENNLSPAALRGAYSYKNPCCWRLGARSSPLPTTTSRHRWP